MADHSDDLDQLLDSALDDFQTLNLTSSTQRGVDNNGDNNGENKQEGCTLTGGNIQGLGMGLPDLKMKKKGKQKVQPPKQESHVTEALDKLREQTREAVKGLESVSVPRPPMAGDGFGGDPMMEDWVKQFEELAGSQDMESIVETMMQQLLSKEILYEPMKEIGERYPKWLEENKAKLTNEEYGRYSQQYEFIKDLNQVYEAEPENFNKIVELMQKMQECGQPPNDIVQELAPDFDLSNLGQLTPEMFESQQNCRIILPAQLFQMMPEYVGSGLDSKVDGRWKQMGNEEKKAMVDEEMKKMQRLPPNSSYASHRLRVLNKIHQLLSLQRNSSQDVELELLFSGLRI